MRIIKQKITASTTAARIPSEFAPYYDIISDEELEEMTGFESTPYLCEEVPGYDAKHLAYAIAKPEYQDRLADNAIDVVELISEGGGEPFLGTVAGDRLYPVTEEDLEMAGVYADE